MSIINLDKTKIRIIILLSFFILMGMSIDLFAPSLPGISSSLKIDPSTAKMVISMYLIGYALGNFIIGIITDAIGRRTLLRASCVLFVIISILPPLIPNEYVLLVVRFFQGFLMGSMGVLSRGVFSDILPAEKLLKLGPTIGFLWGLGPIVGPIIGGFLQEYFGWESGFYFFAIITLIITILVFIYIPETIAKKTSLKFSQVYKNIIEVVSNKQFMSLCVAMGMAYSMIISFNTLGPFLIQDVMGYSPAYFGKLAIFLGCSFLPAPIIARKLLDYFPVSKIFFIMTHFFILLILLFFISSYFMQSSISLLIVATMTVYFVCGSIFPLSMGKGISMFSHISGTAAAIMYLTNMTISSLTSFIQGYLHADTITNIVAIYLVLIAIIVGLYWYKLKDL
ncbi:MFS transporter [Francisella uliginis]|uniref:MFS transporter n=1 Tax=Francisella uliginis TaxID=573570 RepID=UPI000A615A40|nr:MFS transporter [Francisella uliginis]